MTLKTTLQSLNMSKSATVLSVFAIFDKSQNLFYLKCAKTLANNSKNERRAKPVRAGNGKRVSMWSQGEHVKALLLLLLLLLIILLLFCRLLLL